MKTGEQLAKRFRELFDGRWVAATNFKIQLSDLDWKLATQQVDSLNTIAVLTSHVHYYIAGVLNVLQGGALEIKDKFSFDFPPVQSQEDWQNVMQKLWSDAETFAAETEQMTEEKLNAVFWDKKYGTYQRNIEAMIEHGYYHLGQIVLIKKLLLNK